MVKQVEDGKVNTLERLQNIWMKVTRGDVATRFDKIKRVYLDVAEDSRDQVEREHIIANAYQDFRGAVKESEVLALEVLKKAEEKLNAAKEALDLANKAVADFKGEDKAELARLELGRDERLRDVQNEEKRYQVAKDLADNLTVSYNTSEVIMARLRQTTSAKERVYRQAITFFGTNETVLTALTASFTGLNGLHESTQTLEAMKEGVSKSLEDLAEIGGKCRRRRFERATAQPSVSRRSRNSWIPSRPTRSARARLSKRCAFSARRMPRRSAKLSRMASSDWRG